MTTSTPLSAGGGWARMALFALVVLVPVAALGYVYYDFKATGGIRETDQGVKVVDLKAMSDFPFDQENGTIDDVPPLYRGLDGQKVVLEGEMFTTTSASGRVDRFDLVYSIADCCYGNAPQVQHFVDARPADGGTVKFYRGTQVRVSGTLNVDVRRDGGRVTSVYQLAVDEVEPLG